MTAFPPARPRGGVASRCDGPISGWKPWVAMIAVCVAGNCGGDGGQAPDPDAIATVSVSPTSASVDVGSTTQLQATARNAAGEAVSATFSWSSGASAIATVSGVGVVTGVSAGSASITANAGGRSGNATVTVNDPFPPSAPSGVQATPMSDTQIQVTWTDNANNETGFRIEREAAASDFASGTSTDIVVLPAYAQAGTTGPNVTTFLDAGLTVGTDYRYRVLGCNENGCSNPSGESSPVSTLDQPVLTVRKEVQSYLGGTPDNPADPSLTGFEFEVRTAGSATVVATIVTDAAGVAQASLPSGMYDVRETDGKGLEDVTQAINGKGVIAGQANSVSWVNRQPAVPLGILAVQKQIQSSAGGSPNNPSNPPLSGFAFQIRVSGSSMLLATVTTGADGKAFANVPAGSYDVIETDAQGLTDFTMLAAGVVVTDGNDTGIGWINRQALQVSGTLTLVKTVQGKDGGAAVPPFTLAGYAFDVRQTGTATVVAQLVTDATGKAEVMLPAGSYDIIETDAQLLIDVTGPSGMGNDIPIMASQDTPLNWINKQQHLVGMLRSPNQHAIIRRTIAPFDVVLFPPLQGSIPPLFGGAMGNGNLLTIDFIPAGPDNVLVAERNPVTGAIIRTFTEDVRTMGSDPCYQLACLATLQTPTLELEVWRLDPFTSTWTMVAPGRDATVVNGPNGETQIYFDNSSGAMMKREPGIFPGPSGGVAAAVGPVTFSGLPGGFNYYEPSVCPGNGTILLRRTPVSMGNISDIVAFDLDLQAAMLTNQRVLTTDGGSAFPVCLDDSGMLPEYFFNRVIALMGSVWKSEANGTQVSLGDPAEYRPFRWR